MQILQYYTLYWLHKNMKKLRRKGTQINTTAEEYNNEIVKAIKLLKTTLRKQGWSAEKIEQKLPYAGQRIGQDLFSQTPKGPLAIIKAYLKKI